MFACSNCSSTHQPCYQSPLGQADTWTELCVKIQRFSNLQSDSRPEVLLHCIQMLFLVLCRQQLKCIIAEDLWHHGYIIKCEWPILSPCPFVLLQVWSQFLRIRECPWVWTETCTSLMFWPKIHWMITAATLAFSSHTPSSRRTPSFSKLWQVSRHRAYSRHPFATTFNLFLWKYIWCWPVNDSVVLFSLHIVVFACFDYLCQSSPNGKWHVPI